MQERDQILEEQRKQLALKLESLDDSPLTDEVKNASFLNSSGNPDVNQLQSISNSNDQTVIADPILEDKKPYLTTKQSIFNFDKRRVFRLKQQESEYDAVKDILHDFKESTDQSQGILSKLRHKLNRSMTGYAGALMAPFDPLIHMNLDKVQTEKLK